MKLINRNILIISPQPWNHLFVSKHHYAVHLAARGNRVFFLNPPGKEYMIQYTDFENLAVLDYPGFRSGIRFSPKFLRKRSIKKVFRELQELAQIDFNIIWSFDNSVFYDLDALPKSVLKISHIVDLNQDYMTAQAARSADLCLGVTNEIVNRSGLYNPKSYFINHGYSMSIENDSQLILPISEGLKVCYAGNLDIKYLDWELIKTTVTSYTNMSFYFAGSCNDEFKKHWFDHCENVSYMGVLSQSDLNKFYSQADILIIVYKADDFRQQLANPHKILEYLGTGKPIVATYTEEYSDKEDLLYMSKSNSDWLSVFDYVSSTFSECSSERLVSMRKKFALENTYDKQIDRIEELITNEISK